MPTSRLAPAALSTYISGVEQDTDDIPVERLQTPNGRIAFRRREGTEPTVLFLPGYASDMAGAKATALDRFADKRGLGCLRFDYSGTGSSDGDFADGTLDGWLQDSLSVVDELTSGPLVLVGSSMGGWLALLIALRRPDRVRAILGIAAAPDFTDWGFDAADRQRLQDDGQIAEANPDGTPGRFFTRNFWQSGQQLLLGKPVDVRCAVRLIHGDADDAVPLSVATALPGRLRSADVQLTIVKGGGHRLSEPHEIAAMLRLAADLVEPFQ
jgi:pimeloyl-ACP methyl ester carboxylesterase